MIRHQLDTIEASLDGSAAGLLKGLRRLCGTEQMTPICEQRGREEVTPSSIARPGKKASMVTTPMRCKLDFDAFPTTPTLDQLGLSGQTMAVVGIVSFMRI